MFSFQSLKLAPLRTGTEFKLADIITGVTKNRIKQALKLYLSQDNNRKTIINAIK